MTNDGEWVYRVVQKENPGIELGCTAQYGQIYGDKFYVMSKQEKDPGASVVGGRVNILDAKTMKMEKQIQTISTNADGRAFLGVDEHKGYVGTSNGIFILNLDKQEIAGSIEEPQMVEAVLTISFIAARLVAWFVLMTVSLLFIRSMVCL